MGDIGGALATGFVSFFSGLNSGDWLTCFSIAGAVATSWFQHLRTLRVERLELYQRLETASLSVFDFEAKEADRLERYRDEALDEDKFPDKPKLKAAYGSMGAFVRDGYKSVEDGDPLKDPEALDEMQAFEKDWRVARKYYEQTLNLFEMATRFRNKKIIEPLVYGSWVIWFYDTLCEWSFREHWADLKQNYTPDLRRVFNLFVAEFDESEEIDARKARYFQYIAEVTKCPVVGKWLETVEEQDRETERLMKRRLRAA